MGTLKNPLISVEQFLNFEAPPSYRAELFDREIVLSPAPKPTHHDVVVNIFELLERHLGKLFKVSMRTNMDLREAHYMPSSDIFVRTHESRRQAREENCYPSGSSILAVEVISPSHTEPNVQRKTDVYLWYGAVQVWTVYPQECQVIVYDAASYWEAAEGESIALPHPFPSLQLNSGEFFLLA